MNKTEFDAYYKILGLKPGASLSEVKQAYRNLVKTKHPDLFTHNPQLKQEAEEKFRKITEAYKELQKVDQSNYPSNNPQVRSDSTNSSQTTNSSNIATSILRSLRLNLHRIIPIVVVVNIINVVLIFMTLHNSSNRNNSTPEIASTPQNNSTPEIASTPQNNSTPETASSPLPPQQCRVVDPTVGKSARVFSQPSKQAYTGKRIPQDTKVSFIGGVREFVEIELADKSKGWVFNDQIHPCSVPSNSSFQTASTLPLRQCLAISPTVGRSARLFSHPSKEAFTGKRIPQDTRVSYIGGVSEFVEIEFADKSKGWVFNDQILPCSVPSNSSLQTASSPFPSRQCRIVDPTIGRSARVFSYPSKEAFTGKRIPQGTRVSFIGGIREFVEIELADKSKGWVFNDQIHPCSL